MSTAIYWVPERIGKNRVGNLNLKKALQKRFGSPVDARLDDRDISFLEGVDAASEDSGAVDLIIAINKYQDIRVTEES